MNEPSVFDILSGSLTVAERTEMLDRIHRSGTILFSLPVPEDEGPFDGDLAQKFETFPLFRKVLLFLKALFSRSGMEAQIRRHMLSDLAHRLDVKCPGFIDYRKFVFKARLKDELSAIKESASAVADLLDGVFGADRSSFVALVVGMSMPDLEERLLKDTDPVRVFEEFPSQSEHELKAELERRTDECFVMMSEHDRTCLYEEFKFLEALKRFFMFPFHRMTAQFAPSEKTGKKNGSGPEQCQFFELRSYLADLSSIMFSLKPPPSSVLIDALFIRNLHRLPGGSGGAVSPRTDPQATDRTLSPDLPEREAGQSAGDPKILELSSRIDEAVTRIGSFIKNVPLYDLTRLVLEDLSFRPEACGGGEDWQAVYRQYWKDAISTRISAFLREYKRQEVIGNAHRFLSDRDFIKLNYYPSPSDGSNRGGHFTLCLSFLMSFMQYVFNHRMNRYLKTLLIDGEFYKDDNRIEFTDSYNAFLSLSERIEALDRSFAPAGEFGSQFDRIGQELVPSVLRERKIQAVRTAAEKNAGQIVQSAKNALTSMTRILDGIINGQAGGRYDTLSNLGYLGGRSSGEYVGHLQRIHRDMIRTGDLLNELYDIERYE